ncbi:hypothetical protein FO675_06300 [Riemerella anatipestifer]|uniref:hypothetical protein n=1 Tax=Riemerella anatipestifer TaxID=34085 RepID=UPI001AD7C215|nr:hypothetical protein [Riemerella anatipestifer]MBO4233914.1 hypothetical protein [Riemerella anatipestifer]
MTDKNTLKRWFVKDFRPDQEHFWAWMDSYFHKSEKIPQTQIEGLGDSLANKADASQIPSNIATVDSGDVEGNVHTKEQIAYLLENSGKNMANADLTTTGRRYFTQEHEYVWFTNRSTFLMGSDNSDGVYSTLLLNKTGITLINDKGQGNEVRFSMSEGLFRFSGLKEGVTNTHNYVMAVDDSGIVAKLPAGDLGKNMSNSQVTTTALGGVTQGYNYTWDTAGYYLYFKGLPDKSNDATFNKMVVRDSNGQLAESNGKVLFNNIPDVMNATERTAWMKKWTGMFSSLAPVVDVITFPVIEKGGVQELNIWGSNLYIDPETSHVRVKQKSNPSIWHSADFTVKSSGNISFRINTELLTIGEEYVVEVKHGIFITISNFSFFVVERLFPVDISNLSWSQIEDSNAGIYNRTTRQGNSFFVENLTSATAESGYRNKVVRRFKSAKVLNSGENAIFSFSTNVSYDAGNFEFPRSDFDTIGIGECLDIDPQTTASSSIKAFILGGGKPVNIRLQNGNFIAGGNASGLIVKRGTSLFTSIQVGNSVLFMTSNLIKDINVSVEFQTVARYLNAKSVGTYSLDSIYKF